MAFDTYGGLPVFDIEPDWAKHGEIDINREAWVAKAFAASYAETPEDEPQLAWTWQYLLEDQEEIQDFIDFFDLCRGKWGSFWMPSFCTDLLVTKGFSSGDKALYIQDVGYEKYWLPNDCLGRHVQLLFPDGSVAHRKIEMAPASGMVYLDQPLGYTCPEANLNFVMCSFLLFCRFGSDDMELEYLLESAARLKMSYVTLPAGECPL